jgi:hypothetical protein
MGELLYGLRVDVHEDEEQVNGRAGLLVQLHAGTGGGKLSLGVGAAPESTPMTSRARSRRVSSCPWPAPGDRPRGLLREAPTWARRSTSRPCMSR